MVAFDSLGAGPVRALPPGQVRALLDQALAQPGVEGTVDLEAQEVSAGQLHYRFETDPFVRGGC